MKRLTFIILFCLIFSCNKTSDYQYDSTFVYCNETDERIGMSIHGGKVSESAFYIGAHETYSIKYKGGEGPGEPAFIEVFVTIGSKSPIKVVYNSNTDFPNPCLSESYVYWQSKDGRHIKYTYTFKVKDWIE